MYPCSAHIVTIVTHRSPLLLLLCPYIIIVMSALIMWWPLRLLYIERRSIHLYHRRIAHLCNVKEVAPSKRLNSKALIYLFYLFLSWFHNKTHLQAVKRIFKYLQGTQNYGLRYARDTDLTLHSYTDANWVGSVDDRKSTSGPAFFMSSTLVSWFS